MTDPVELPELVKTPDGYRRHPDGTWRARAGDGWTVTVIDDDQPADLRLRGALKLTPGPDGTVAFHRIAWIRGELNGVRLYVNAAEKTVLLTTRDLKP